MRAGVILALALVLIALQAAILGVGLFAPRVTAQYRAYFIDQTVDTWVREKRPGL